jgi:hypothetical protein
VYAPVPRRDAGVDVEEHGTRAGLEDLAPKDAGSVHDHDRGPEGTEQLDRLAAVRGADVRHRLLWDRGLIQAKVCDELALARTRLTPKQRQRRDLEDKLTGDAPEAETFDSRAQERSAADPILHDDLGDRELRAQRVV